MPSYKTTITVDGQKHNTLRDILPISAKPLEILFIAKTPAPISVEAGHYFQGLQGKMFWNRLKEYKIFTVKPNTFDDENLLDNNYGLTDIIKVPRHFGNEPSEEEYKAGLNRILNTIIKYQPKIIVFIYKKVLDNILKHGYNSVQGTQYGFNKDLEKRFNAKVFVFPMPGTPCTSTQAVIAMTEIKKLLKK